MMLIPNHVSAFAQMVVDREAQQQTQLSQSAVAALLTLWHRGPMTATELAELFQVRQPTTYRLIRNLYDKGLVSRTPTAGGTVRIALSTSGRRRAADIQVHRLQAVDALLSVLSPRERVVLDGLVSRVLAAATPDRATARFMCRFCEHSVCDGEDCPVGSAVDDPGVAA
jgi:DNA-binding MarR family transcriptional regulator